MNKAQELATKLQNAIEANNRIASAKKDVETLTQDIKNLDGITKLIMMDTTIKQMRIDSINKELENAVEIDVQAIQKEIEELG